MKRPRGAKSAAKSTRARRSVTLKIRVLPHGEGLPLPAYQTADAAGFDILAAVPANDAIVIAPGERVLVPTGLSFELPRGLEAQVRPRSGLAAKHGLTVLNSPGTIDADYRGEVQVILINLGKEPFQIDRGARIAQVVIAPVLQVQIKKASRLTETSRGAGGFGSTGTDATPSPRGRKTSKPVPKKSAGKERKSAAPRNRRGR